MKALLAVHITCGFGAFLLAPVALATAKGGKQHKRWGMVYLWAMGGVAATALPMALYRPVLFLAMLSVLSFYLAFSGYRVLKLKDLARGGHAKPVDWIAGVLTFCSSFALGFMGWYNPRAIQGYAVVAIIFGLLGMRISSVQLWSFAHKPQEKMFWWYRHLGCFIGSYITAWSAFSVTTLPMVFGNHLWLWLWPAAVGVPAIVLMTGYYKRKFAPRVPPAAGVLA